MISEIYLGGDNPGGFGVLGIEGFFRYFRTTIDAAEGWFTLEPVVY